MRDRRTTPQPHLNPGGSGAVSRPMAGSHTVLAFVRGSGQDAVLCAFNLGDEPAAWTLPPGWSIAESIHLGGNVASLPPLAGILAQRA